MNYRPWLEEQVLRQMTGLPDDASACLSDGLNPAKVAALIGDTLEVTLATYSHFLPDDDDRARDILGRFFRFAEGTSEESCAQDVPGGS